MKARQLIEQAPSFDPDGVKAMGQAFDEVWADISGHFGANAAGARMRLANAILTVAGNGTRDAAQLKGAAMEIMRQSYPTIRLSHPN